MFRRRPGRGRGTRNAARQRSLVFPRRNDSRQSCNLLASHDETSPCRIAQTSAGAARSSPQQLPPHLLALRRCFSPFSHSTRKTLNAELFSRILSRTDSTGGSELRRRRRLGRLGESSRSTSPPLASSRQSPTPINPFGKTATTRPNLHPRLFRNDRPVHLAARPPPPALAAAALHLLSSHHPRNHLLLLGNLSPSPPLPTPLAHSLLTRLLPRLRRRVDLDGGSLRITARSLERSE